MILPPLAVTTAISLFTAISIGLVVAFFTPRFAHGVWRKQKLREQQLALAERFAKLSSNLDVIQGQLPEASDEAFDEKSSLLLEENALRVLIETVFKRKETIAAGESLFVASGRVDREPLDVNEVHELRTQLLACMFAEALNISRRPRHRAIL